ncbi:MAG: CoA-binding protein [Streptosporangiales bacterium]|nr:CoA-binding protein [Streptosporangiales bacterium]
MTTRDHLRRLLAPRHIAVVGGTAAEEAIRQSRLIGFEGEIWPVHPRRETLSGLPCFPDVDALPEAPDAAFVAVPREATVGVVSALAARGAGGVVCHASGFAEHGPAGEALQRALVDAAGDMALIGPNCMGMLNYLDGAALWSEQHGGHRVDRGVAVITQSGNLGQNLTMQRRSLPLAQLVTVGNGAVTGVPDLMAAMLDDPRITAIGLHLEGIADTAAFSRVCLEALHRQVPVIALKSGTSQLGARVNLSHTSALSGSDTLWDALFRRLGIARVRQVGTFIETLKFLHVHGGLAGPRIASASCSGGEAALVADLAHERGVELPAFPEAAEGRLREVLGDRVHVANPLDYHTYIWGDERAMTECFAAVLSADFDSHLLVLDYPRDDRCLPRPWQTTVDAFVAARRRTSAPACVVSLLPEGLPEPVGEALLREDIAPMQGMADCLDAVASAWTIGAAQRSAAAIAPLDPPAGGVTADPPVQLDEWSGKQALAAYGLRVPDGRIVAADTATEAAAELGYPVVVKTLSPSIAHKTDVGGVRLRLTRGRQVRAAVAAMADLGDRFLVERMVGGSLAELIVGVHRDAQFGLALTIGAGGELVELVRDVATLLLPVSREEIEAALRSLRIWPLLAGYRGRPAADVDAVVDAVVAVAAYARAHQSHLVELDVNPLLVLPTSHGAVAVDVLVRLAEDTSASLHPCAS